MYAAVVDPSRVVLKLITKLLVERGDMSVEFTDSSAALRCVKDDPAIDTLITSLEVQPLNGLELCWEARMAMPARRPFYIMVMSSLSDESKLAEALDCGADDMIAKPFNPVEFYARVRMAGRMKRTQLHLVRLAETDSLTGLFNRRAFFEQLNTRLIRPDLAASTVALLIDIDNFKSVNDTYGHDVGDKVITAVAAEVSKIGLFAARLGGEEFAAIIEGMPENRLLKLADNLRRACAALSFETENESLSVTVSVGVSRWAPGDRNDDLLKKADIALYSAKNEGRNRVRVATEKVLTTAKTTGLVRYRHRTS